MPIYAIFPGYTVIGQKWRPAREVKQALAERGIQSNLLTVRRLRMYTNEQFATLLVMIDRLLSAGHKFQHLAVPRFGSFPFIRPLDVPQELLEACRHNGLLDLRGLRQKLQDRANLSLVVSSSTPLPLPVVARLSNRPVVGWNSGRLISFMAVEDGLLRKVADKPNATLDKLFRSLGHGTEKLKDILGFNSIAIYRPVEDGGGKWMLTYATRKFAESVFAREKGGAYPDAKQTTVGWLIRHGKTGDFYDVDIFDAQSFERAGLPYHERRARIDRENTKGPGRTLFIKIASRFGTEAVIQIHNRVEKNAAGPAPGELLPENREEAEKILTLLKLYFNLELVGAIERIRARQLEALRKEDHLNPAMELSPDEKTAILKTGEPRVFQGQPVRVFEAPSEKFYRQLTGVVNWLRQTILGIYEGTSIAAGKNEAELVKALSLEDARMLERVVYSRYTILLEGAPGDPHELQGLLSYNLLEINADGRKVEVLKVPEAMIRKEARGRKLQVALTHEIGRRALLKLWLDNGLFKGFWLALTKGVPIYATTQSKRVIRGMSRLANFTLKRIVDGKPIDPEHRLIIDQCSEGKADELGVEPRAYGGRIAIDEEEQSIPVFGPRRDARLNKVLDRLGVDGRIHLIGNLTLWVSIKVMFELWWSRLFGRRRK